MIKQNAFSSKLLTKYPCGVYFFLSVPLSVSFVYSHEMLATFILKSVKNDKKVDEIQHLLFEDILNLINIPLKSCHKIFEITIWMCLNSEHDTIL